MTDYVGTAGNDSIVGTDGDDTFDMSQGGKDTVIGGAGDDTFTFGAAFTAADRVQGGDGFDILDLQGDYSAGLTLAPNSLSSIERIEFLSGFDYRLTLVDGNVDPGTQLDLSNNHGANSIWVDASAIVNGGSVSTYSDQANTIMGSQSNDLFSEFTSQFDLHGDGGDDLLIIYSGLDRHSVFDGGDGVDTIELDSQFTGTLRASQMKNVENLALNAQSDITLSDGNVAKGQMLAITIYGGVSDRVDGAAETDGTYIMVGGEGADTMIGGAGADTLSGATGDDVLTGGKGADSLTGGAGADSFLYLKTGDSLAKAPDLISDFDPTTDHIDLSAIDARTDVAGNQAFHLVHKFTHVSGQLVLVYDSDANVTHVEGDVNGDGKADLFIDVAGHLTDTTGFVL